MQIRRRLEGREASTRQAAESKRVFEIEGGFIMQRWRGGPELMLAVVEVNIGHQPLQGLAAVPPTAMKWGHTAVPRFLSLEDSTPWSCDMCCKLQGSQQRCQARRQGCPLRWRSPTARQRRRRPQLQKL